MDPYEVGTFRFCHACARPLMAPPWDPGRPVDSDSYCSECERPAEGCPCTPINSDELLAACQLMIKTWYYPEEGCAWCGTVGTGGHKEGCPVATVLAAIAKARGGDAQQT